MTKTPSQSTASDASIELDGADLKVRGLITPSDDRFIQVYINGRASRPISYSAFMGSGAEADRLLAAQGMPLLRQHAREAKSMVAGLTTYLPRQVATEPGWIGSSFAMPSGKVYASDPEDTPLVAYLPATRQDAACGKLAKWRDQVAAPLAGQHLATFALMVPFTAPLLSIVDHPTNFGFELSGPGAVGKTTLCQLAASTLGPADDLLCSMNATTNALDQQMASTHDLPFFLEEANFLALQNGRGAGAKAAELSFLLGYGAAKSRLNAQVKDRSRFVWMMSSNRPFPSILEGLETDTADAAMDRIIAINIKPSREFGVFDRIADCYDTAGEMAAGLVKATHEQHGTAFKRYMRKLTPALHDHQDALAGYINGYRDEFVAAVAGEGGARSDRVVQAFELVYAAGRLAQHFEALPTAFRCLKATKRVYRMHLESRKEIASAPERLVALLKSPGLLDLDLCEDGKASMKEFEAATAIRYKWGYGEEILLSQDQLARAFPKRKELFSHPVIKRCLIPGEKNRKQNYRYVGNDKISERLRFYCFSCETLREEGYL